MYYISYICLYLIFIKNQLKLILHNITKVVVVYDERNVILAFIYYYIIRYIALLTWDLIGFNSIEYKC